MRPRSLVGPLLLIIVGGLFLANNLNPDLPLFRLIAMYWPFLLIGWGALRLIEILALAAMRKPYPAGIGGGEIALIVLICLAGTGMYAFHRHFEGRMHFGVWGPRTLEMFGEEHEYPVQAEQPVSGAKRVVIEHGRGDLRIVGAETDRIRVTGRKGVRAFDKSAADQANQRTPIEILSEGERAVVRTHQERATGHVRFESDLEITVPKGAAVEVRGQVGDIEVANIEGDIYVASDNAGVRIENAGGAVRVHARRSDVIRAVDVRGTFEAESRGGDVELENIRGEVRLRGSYSGTLQFQKLAKPLVFETRQTELRLAALPGRITMDLADFTASDVVGPFRMVAKSRDVDVENVTNDIEIETERGDTEIRLGRAPQGRIAVRSRSGNIELALPAESRFRLEATTERGEAENDFGPAVQVTSEGAAAAMKGGAGSGPLVKLTTGRGSIALRKSEPRAPERALQETHL